MAFSAMQDYHKLRAWCLADELATSLKGIFAPRGSGRVTWLSDQSIRVAQSIAANLAEGCGRSSRAQFLVFIDFSLGSATELENHLGTARKEGIIHPNLHYKLRGRLIALQRMIRALRNAIERAIAFEENARKRPKTKSVNEVG